MAPEQQTMFLCLTIALREHHGNLTRVRVVKAQQLVVDGTAAQSCWVRGVCVCTCACVPQVGAFFGGLQVILCMVYPNR